MAKQIKVGIRLPSNSQLKTEMQSVVKLMEKYATLDFKIDTKEFSKSLSSMSNELSKLKAQLGKFNILESINGDSSKIAKTKQEVDALANAMGKLNEKSQLRVNKDTSNWQLKQAQAVNGALDEQYNKQLKLDSLRTQLQGKLSIASNNGFVDTGVIDNLQMKLNSISSDTAEREILELKNSINNLSSSDGSIIRIQNSITKLEEKISTIKKNNIDIIDAKEISELKQAETEVEKLKTTLSQLQTGNVIDGKAISNQINTATNSVRTLENQFKSVNSNAGGLSDTMKNIFNYAIGGSAVYTAINSMKTAISTTIELDDAIRDLRRVTELANSEYSKFMETANQTAIELGATTTGAIEAATRFSQLGYSFKEASEGLSRYALILSNVANMSATEASSSIVSVLKGFQLETEDVERVTDVINEAGNKFAIDSSGLADALKVGAANLSLAGNDLEQASALIITANEIMQDPRTVSNGLKTISMRIRGISEDGEELSATMNELIKDMTGVSVEGLDGELRNTYDIIKDIGEVWDTLNTKQQALLAEEIAGKNRVIIAPYVQKCA